LTMSHWKKKQKKGERKNLAGEREKKRLANLKMGSKRTCTHGIAVLASTWPSKEKGVRRREKVKEPPFYSSEVIGREDEFNAGGRGKMQTGKENGGGVRYRVEKKKKGVPALNPPHRKLRTCETPERNFILEEARGRENHLLEGVSEKGRKLTSILEQTVRRKR